jgi:hypothetical protein
VLRLIDRSEEGSPPAGYICNETVRWRLIEESRRNGGCAAGAHDCRVSFNPAVTCAYHCRVSFNPAVTA